MRRRYICSRRGMQGLTLVELMVSLALGLLVVLASTGLLMAARSSYLVQDDEVLLQETGRFALDIIARAVRQAGYEHWDADANPLILSAGMSPNILGQDATRLTAALPELRAATTPAINGSDVLAVRFFGAGQAGQGDGTIVNCAGFAVGAPSSPARVSEERGWSIFYVGVGPDGQAALYCKYQGKSAGGRLQWRAEPIASGVESFQVLYGLDLDDNGLPDRYVRAAEVVRLDNALGTSSLDLNRRTHWKKVVVVQLALLMRGRHRLAENAVSQSFDLFGPGYSRHFASTDPGVLINVDSLPVNEQTRARRLFSLTVQLRNRAGGSAA